MEIFQTKNVLWFYFLEPNNIESEKCTSLSHKDGTWSSDNCDDSKSFTCRFKSSKIIISNVITCQNAISRRKEIVLFDFTSFFFAWIFLKFSGPPCAIQLTLFFQHIIILAQVVGKNGITIVICYNLKSLV